SISDREWACSFLFQAEDGIRDRNVTGVQTCALPILADHAAKRFFRKRIDLEGDFLADLNVPDVGFVGLRIDLHFLQVLRDGKNRSEERRVGKECRYGWVVTLLK